MPDKSSDKEWLASFISGKSDSEEWASLAKDLPRRISGLLPEDQETAAEKLSSLSGSQGVPNLIEEAYAQEGISLPARIILAKAMIELGKDTEQDLVQRLEKWALLCEGDEAECRPDDFFLLPEADQEAVLEHLALWLRADILENLKEAAPDKAKRKVLAKALHRAKSAGAEVSLGGEGRFVMPQAGGDEYYDEAFISPPDYTGTSFIYIYRTVFGKHSLFVVLISDLQGVLRFEGYEVSKKRFDKMLESTRKNPHAIVVKADPGYVRRLIRGAEEAGRKKGKGQNEEYLRNRRAIGVADEPDAPHPVWESFDREELSKERGFLYSADELLGHRVFEDWRMIPVREGEFFMELTDVRQGVLELTPQQKKEREDTLLEKEVNKILAHEGRETWRDRLLNCSYVLTLLGDDEAARISSFLALHIEASEDPVPSFLVELLRRTVVQAKREGEDDDGEDGPDMDRGGIVVV